MQEVFISHSSKDLDIVNAFIDEILVGALAIQVNDIFCTSTEGTKIKSGDDWRKSIRLHLKNSRIIFLIITPNFKESEVCLNEMGAAWVLSKNNVITLTVEPINYKTVGVIEEPKQLEKLLDESSLDRIRDVVKNKLNIPSRLIKSDRWSVKKIAFIEKVKMYIENNPFPAPLGREEYDNALAETKNQKQAYRALLTDIAKLQTKIEKLKKAKDKKEIQSIEREFSDSSVFEKFEELASEVSGCLEEFDGIITGLAFLEYSNKNISLDINSSWKEEINEAISCDYITEELAVNWETTRQMSDLYFSLENLSKFMDENEDEIIEQFEEKYKATFSVLNIEFWREVFEKSVHIS